MVLHWMVSLDQSSVGNVMVTTEYFGNAVTIVVGAAPVLYCLRINHPCSCISQKEDPITKLFYNPTFAQTLK